MPDGQLYGEGAEKNAAIASGLNQFTVYLEKQART
jgi:hypothetical protein